METLVDVYQQQGCLFYNILAKLPKKNNVIQFKKRMYKSPSFIPSPVKRATHEFVFLKDQKKSKGV